MAYSARDACVVRLCGLLCKSNLDSRLQTKFAWQSKRRDCVQLNHRQ